jgi:hypothetical protein
MENDNLILTALNDLKCSIKELRDEIKDDINSHKRDNSDDINKLYEQINKLKELTTILDTKVMFWQWIASIGILGAGGAVISSIMQLILK